MRAGPKSILGLGTPLSLRGPLCPGKGGGVIRTFTIMRDALVLRDTQRLIDNG